MAATRRAFWTDAHDAALRQHWEANLTNTEIAKRLKCSEGSVYRHATLLGLPNRSARWAALRFWTPARESALREMWNRTPKLTLEQMARELGGEVSGSYISFHAGRLGLPGRHSSVSVKAAEFKSPFKGESPVQAVERPAPRLAPPEPRHQPCPYWVIRDRRAAPCGEMVDRKRDREGEKPSPYCAAHKPKVLPIGKGMLGAISAGRQGITGMGGVRK